MVSARIWTAAGLGVLVAIALTVVSCFSVSYKSGTIKCAPGEDTDMGRACPQGSRCIDGYCYITPDLLGTVGDASIVIVTDGGTLDGSPGD